MVGHDRRGVVCSHRGVSACVGGGYMSTKHRAAAYAARAWQPQSGTWDGNETRDMLASAYRAGWLAHRHAVRVRRVAKKSIGQSLNAPMHPGLVGNPNMQPLSNIQRRFLQGL